jgi:lipid-binding SYLF domain-containing protein
MTNHSSLQEISMKISKLVATIGFAAALTATGAFASDETELVAHATRVAEHMKSDPAFAAAHDMLGRARAILIVPALVKGGFVFGAEGGNGVLLKRNGRGWSSPAFYSMGSASFGLQIGLEKAEIVLLIMSDRALHGVEQDEFKIGAGGGITAVTLSSGAEGATSGHGGDIVVWTSATGAYGGLTFNGSVIKPRHEWNTDYYGHRVGVPAILSSSVHNPDSRALQAELGR